MGTKGTQRINETNKSFYRLVITPVIIQNHIRTWFRQRQTDRQTWVGRREEGKKL